MSGRPVTRKSVHHFVPGQWVAKDMLFAWVQLVERDAAVQRKQARVLVGEWVYGEKIQSDKGCRQASLWLRKRVSRLLDGHDTTSVESVFPVRLETVRSHRLAKYSCFRTKAQCTTITGHWRSWILTMLT